MKRSDIGAALRRVWANNPLRSNPMLAKELRSRTRTWRSPAMVTGYVLLIGLIALAYLLIAANQFRYGGGPQVGMQIFSVLSLFQLMLLAFITPALTASAINGERERQTFDLLMCTRLSPSAVVFGKLVSSMAYVLLLIFASLPLFSVVFLFGGISLRDLGLVFGVDIATALTFGVFGLFLSAVLRRPQASTVMAYAASFFMVFGTVMVGLFLQGWQAARGIYDFRVTPILLFSNPLLALISVLGGPYGNVPYIAFFPLPLPNLYRGPQPYPAAPGAKVPTGLWAKFLQLPPWAIHFTIDAVLIVVLLALTIYLIRPVKRAPRWLVAVGRWMGRRFGPRGGSQRTKEAKGALAW